MGGLRVIGMQLSGYRIYKFEDSLENSILRFKHSQRFDEESEVFLEIDEVVVNVLHCQVHFRLLTELLN